MKIVILQPSIPHYRSAFFNGLNSKVNYDLFSLDESHGDRSNLNKALIDYQKLKVVKFWKFKWYNPFRLLLKYDVIVIPGELSYLSNWLLLLMSRLLDKHIVVWGHGLNYSQNKPISIGYWLLYFLSKSAIFYTEKEMRFWRKKLSTKFMSFINNTVEINTNKVDHFYNTKNVSEVKRRHKITHEKIFISCYRFTNLDRKDEDLFELIKKCERTHRNVGFIIIGTGKLKPDFSGLTNVYDFGELYDSSQKLELFFISDFYLQLGWTGLSIVEAFAHKKPVITLKRSTNTKQSVEYFYLKNNYNSIILNSIHDFDKVTLITKEKSAILSNNSFNSYVDNLNMNSMINNFKNHLNDIQ